MLSSHLSTVYWIQHVNNILYLIAVMFKFITSSSVNTLIMIEAQYDMIEEFNVDSKADYSA